MALKKPATQSSMHPYNKAKNAPSNGNDGDNTTRSVTYYKNLVEWWSVDMESVVEIVRIVLHLVPNKVYNGAKISTRVSESDAWSLCADMPTPSGMPPYIVEIRCQHPTNAQFVQVSKPGNTILYLLEVEVYGKGNYHILQAFIYVCICTPSFM